MCLFLWSAAWVFLGRVGAWSSFWSHGRLGLMVLWPLVVRSPSREPLASILAESPGRSKGCKLTPETNLHPKTGAIYFVANLGGVGGGGGGGGVNLHLQFTPRGLHFFVSRNKSVYIFLFVPARLRTLGFQDRYTCSKNASGQFHPPPSTVSSRRPSHTASLTTILSATVARLRSTRLHSFLQVASRGKNHVDESFPDKR